jgi:hypothetical protein
MIYCVIPEPMADELLEKMEKYYADDPNVTVIVDRRRSERRGRGPVSEEDLKRRTVRDRRRPRVTGELPELETG